MKIVIEIPDAAYNAIHACKNLPSDAPADELTSVVMSAVVNGIPLPKGHGRLIDADKLKTEFEHDHDFLVNAWGCFSNMPVYDKARVDEILSSIASVVNADTVVEAYKDG